MPDGKGTYGNVKGRPPKNNTKKVARKTPKAKPKKRYA